MLGTDVGRGPPPTAPENSRTRERARGGHYHASNPADGAEPLASIGRSRPTADLEASQPASLGSSSGGRAAATVVASDIVGSDCGDQGCAAGDGAGRCRGRELSKGSGGAALLPAIAAGRTSQPEREESHEEGQERKRQPLPQPRQQQQESATSVVSTADRGTVGTDREPQDPAPSRERRHEAVGTGMALWPESSILPPGGLAEDSGGAADGVEGGRRRGDGTAPHFMDTEALKAVARLFLSKLHVSVEVSTL